jgi:cytochrome c oxidase subunit 2
MATVINLAADYGWGPYTLVWIFVIVIAVATAGFFIVMATTRMKKKQTFASKRRYESEMFWTIGVAAVLIWLWVNSYPWMPPIAFSAANDAINNNNIQVVNITAGQWFWLMSKDGHHVKPENSPQVTLQAGMPVKFIAHSIDVNHGFGIFHQSFDSSILLQMQVIPGMDNVFYYTFKEPGMYMLRCLEYCGYAHPYMTSQIEVVPEVNNSTITTTTAAAQGEIAQ